MPVSDQEIEYLISNIPDPEIPVVTIKDLGILRRIDFVNGNYEVTITPTYTACPAMKYIEDEILNKFSLIGHTNVKVKLTYSPAWTTDWISEEAKEKMRRYGISPPQHTSCSKVYGTQRPKVNCPRCNSVHTDLISQFGSTACKAYYYCNQCKETFELFKCH